VRGHHVFTGNSTVTATNQFSVSLHPRAIQSTRLINYCDIFEGYKINRFRIGWCQALSGGALTPVGVAYRPTRTLDNSPFTFSAVSEIDKFNMSLVEQTAQSHLRINGLDLHGEQDWYDTTNQAEFPGIMLVSTPNPTTGLAVAGFFTLFMEWEYTFYGPVPTVLTMSRMKEKVREELMHEEFDGSRVISDDESSSHVSVVSRKRGASVKSK
jgi:hypothetical protein